MEINIKSCLNFPGFGIQLELRSPDRNIILYFKPSNSWSFIWLQAADVNLILFQIYYPEVYKKVEVHTLPMHEAAKVLIIWFTDYANKQLLKIVRANMIKEKN